MCWEKWCPPEYGQYGGWENKGGRTDAKVGWSEVKARVRGFEACRENPEEVVAVEMSSDVGSSAYLPPPHLKHFSELESDSRISLPDISHKIWAFYLRLRLTPLHITCEGHTKVSSFKLPSEVKSSVIFHSEAKNLILKFFWACTSKIL